MKTTVYVSYKNPFSFFLYDHWSGCPTACAIVPEGDTCAGAGTAKPSNQKNEKACEIAWDVRRIPSVRCTLCWTVLWITCCDYGRLPCTILYNDKANNILIMKHHSRIWVFIITYYVIIVSVMYTVVIVYPVTIV